MALLIQTVKNLLSYTFAFYGPIVVQYGNLSNKELHFLFNVLHDYLYYLSRDPFGTPYNL